MTFWHFSIFFDIFQVILFFFQQKPEPYEEYEPYKQQPAKTIEWLT